MLYPTTQSLHEAIKKIPGIPWAWSESTTKKILMLLGFRYFNTWHFFSLLRTKNSITHVFSFIRWLANHQVDAGLLSEDKYVVARRIAVCKELLELEEQGYYIAYLDES